jgi:hypothetical protein
MPSTTTTDAPPAALTPCQVEALRRCLEEHDGSQAKCAKEIEAFKAACGGGGSGSGAAAQTATTAAPPAPPPPPPPLPKPQR